MGIGVKVRDRTEPKSEYKGRPTACSERDCPCRPCWNAHDCGCYLPSYDDVPSSGGYVVKMECATRYNSGCPIPKPEPEHVYSGPRGRVCMRCGHKRPTQGERADAGEALRTLIQTHLATAAKDQARVIAEMKKQYLHGELWPALEASPDFREAAARVNVCQALLEGRAPEEES